MPLKPVLIGLKLRCLEKIVNEIRRFQLYFITLSDFLVGRIILNIVIVELWRKLWSS